jgi:hypothetical protein
MDDVRTGGCLCGAIRYHIAAPPVEALYCHCRICQRAHGAPVVAWLTVDLAGDRQPSLPDVSIATLDEPGAVAPGLHLWTQH